MFSKCAGSDADKKHHIQSFLYAITDEERGEERARHHNDRLLAGRLEREQEKVLR